ncbi:MAG: DUF3021 domain-containing protein [Oscillospiraceae bacterium]|nr:DUF3021 domain-containing protein [Oscillospiraceae bacterium]
MKLKEVLKFMVATWLFATTLQTLFIGIVGLLFPQNGFVLTARDLLKLPFIAFMSAVPELIFLFKPTASRTEVTVRKILHFVLTAGIVFTLLIYFGWIDASGAILTGVFFLVIYVTLYIYQDRRDKKTAEKINQRINATHHSENATHDDKA